MKLFINYFIFLQLLLFNINIVFAESTENYFKGKFYKSVKNNFLVATDKMTDKRFKNTVIVMIDNDKEGAWGLVINKPMGSIFLDSLISNLEISEKEKQKLKNIKIEVFWGGPVNENDIFILHSKDYEGKNTKKIKNISISRDYNTLIDIAKKQGPKKSLIIMGYSGWGSGQLEGEMERDHWILSIINNDIIFNIHHNKKWIEAIKNSFINL